MPSATRARFWRRSTPRRSSARRARQPRTAAGLAAAARPDREGLIENAAVYALAADAALALDLAAQCREALAHQLAATHVVAMRLVPRATDQVHDGGLRAARGDLLATVNALNRSLASFQRAIRLIDRLPHPAQAAPAPRPDTNGGDGPLDGGGRKKISPNVHAPHAQWKHPLGEGGDQRKHPLGEEGDQASCGLGRLKNGNRTGDFRSATRCGAHTRAGCACRQPAMKNGRCRLHGGKLTGPRSAAGQERAATARLVHGRYGRDARDGRALRSTARAVRQGLEEAVAAAPLAKPTVAIRQQRGNSALTRQDSIDLNGIGAFLRTVGVSPAPRCGRMA